MTDPWSNSLHSKEFWDQVFPSASLILFAIDQEGILRFVSGREIEQLGRKPQELNGKPLLELFPEESGISEGILRAQKGEKYRGPVSVAGLVFDFSLNPILDSNGKVLGVSGVGTDITSEARMELQVRESEERFRILSEATAEGVAITKGGTIVDANISLAGMLGVPGYKLLGTSVLNLFPAESQEELKSHLVPGESQLMETRMKTKRGNWFPAEVGSRPLPFHDQEALVVTIRDITARKKTEDLIQKKNDELNSINAELQSANDKLRDAYSRLRDAHKKRKSIEEQLILAEKRASLGTMAAGIAHEIAQPLNGLKIMVDGMEYWFRQGKKIEFPIIREKLKKVSNHANRINEIISYMRAVYRNRETVNLELVDLNQAIKGAVAMIANACEDEEIRIELSLSKDLPKIRAQSLQAEQIVLNLAQNSIQALRGIESKDRWIQIKTWVSGETVRFRIGDNGVGLGQEVGRIFDPFYTTHEAGGGMGLGLCIVQNLISAWNGKIKASKRKKGGAYFSFELPISQSAEAMLKDGVQAGSRDGT